MLGLDAAAGRYTPEIVKHHLYRAGETLMTLQVSGLGPAPIRSGMPVPLDAVSDVRRPPPPSARRISEMDQVLTWVQLIPEQRMALRRLVNARCLCRPTVDGPEPLFTWRQLGDQLGCSHTTARAWFTDAAGLIAAALNRPLFCQSAAIAGTKNLTPLFKAQTARRTRRPTRDLLAV